MDTAKSLSFCNFGLKKVNPTLGKSNIINKQLENTRFCSAVRRGIEIIQHTSTVAFGVILGNLQISSLDKDFLIKFAYSICPCMENTIDLRLGGPYVRFKINYSIAL